MTCVVVNDASCLIDLRKGRLLHVLCQLPYRFVVPLPIRASELLDFTPQEWALLDGAGMETYDLPPDRMADVFTVKRENNRLSANDCFCLVTTQCHDDAVLLTGDGLLRRVATDAGVRVHGVLWIVEELKAAAVCDDALLVDALNIWRADDSVFLPNALIDQVMRQITAA